MIAPISHHADIFDLPQQVGTSILSTTKRIGEHYRTVLNAQGLNLLHASGSAAQQSVFHFHFHLLPRYEHDEIDAWPTLPKWTGDLDRLIEQVHLDNQEIQ